MSTILPWPGTNLAKKPPDYGGFTSKKPARFGKPQESPLKEIILLGEYDGNSILRYVARSSKYRVRKAADFKAVEDLVKSCNPDFILCTGKIQMTPDGRYFLEI